MTSLPPLFSRSPLATKDFRQNVLFYDLANGVFIDQTGYGIEDIRTNCLYLSVAPDTNFQEWSESAPQGIPFSSCDAGSSLAVLS